MKSCAEKRGQVPVKIDHQSGAGAVCGFLSNFKIAGNKLLADWFLLANHPQKAQILEVAQRMPRGVGLSAAFIGPDNAEHGKARCQEIISVDYVTLPAANPNGLFAVKYHERPVSGVERVRRVLAAAGSGAETGALVGIGSSVLLKRRALTMNSSALAGASIGALAGVYRYRKDRSSDLSRRVSLIMLQERNALRRVADTVGDNVSVSIPIPYSDEVEQAQTAIRYAKKPLIRRIAGKIIKVGVGATLGHYVGRRLGSRAGIATGAVAGLLFESSEVRSTVRLGLNYSKRINL
jgi:hypothetical protein